MVDGMMCSMVCGVRNGMAWHGMVWYGDTRIRILDSPEEKHYLLSLRNHFPVPGHNWKLKINDMYNAKVRGEPISPLVWSGLNVCSILGRAIALTFFTWPSMAQSVWQVGTRDTGLRVLSPVSTSDKTSYCKISWSLEAARIVFRIVRSLPNLTCSSAVLLLMCLWNFKTIW